MNPPLIDAHNHLQAARLELLEKDCLSEWERLGVVRAVVNGSSERDWAAVALLAGKYPVVIPSFGLHPWFIRNRGDDWTARLEGLIRDHPRAGVGECGLDKWIWDHQIDDQETVFREHLRLAAKYRRPMTIHCLKAWGRLLDVLKSGPLPEAGFLLHSFSGPEEMIAPLAELGAYFSFSGNFIHEKRKAARETFRKVPAGRLLIETDAPNMSPPAPHDAYSAVSPTGEPVNHPGNIAGIYQFVADMFGKSLADLADQIKKNFERLFAVSVAG